MATAKKTVVKAVVKSKKGGEKKVRALRTGTKMARAIELVKKNPNLPRKIIIQRFIDEVKLTKAGANTYHALVMAKLKTK